MRVNIIFIVVFSLFLAGCTNDEEDLYREGIETRVTGKISDINAAPIDNVKLRVAEYEREFIRQGPAGGNYHYTLIKYVDSTKTNVNGEYNFTFKTTGKGNFYKLSVEKAPVEDQSYWHCCLEDVDMDNIGKVFNHDFKGLTKLYPCDITITLNNISDFPLNFSHETTFFDDSYTITSNVTVVRRLYIEKDKVLRFNLWKTKANGKRQAAYYNFPASNTEALTTQKITINESDFVNLD